MKRVFPFLTLFAILSFLVFSVSSQKTNQRPVQYKGTAFGDPARYKAEAPIMGANISIQLEPKGELIAKVLTNENGEFSFKFPEKIRIIEKGIFSMTLSTPKNEKDIIKVSFVAKEGPNFKYVLTWYVDKASNTGGFAVSGRSSN